MDANKFFKELRKIIKEEVQIAIRTEMNTLYESLDKVSKRVTQEQTPAKRLATASRKPATTFSNNPLINEILNETATSGFSTKDFHGILEESYNPDMLGPNDFEDWPTMRTSPGIGRIAPAPSIIPKTDIDGRPVTEVAPEVEQALTRDYTSLMKAINSKKGK